MNADRMDPHIATRKKTSLKRTNLTVDSKIDRIARRVREIRWHLWTAIRWGDWSCGWEQWNNKPQFDFVRGYYDGYRNALHIGPLWIECDY